MAISANSSSSALDISVVDEIHRAVEFIHNKKGDEHQRQNDARVGQQLLKNPHGGSSLFYSSSAT